MEFAPAGVALSFEVTFDSPSLHVGMTVYDDSGALPVLLLSPFAMVNVGGTNTYRGKFTPENGKNYIIIKAVYTDNTYSVVDPDYSQGSESIVAQYINPPLINNVVGVVQDDTTLVGLVECS